MARKLMVALWRYPETGVVPTGAVLQARFDRPRVVKRPT
jgi:hypothetical protein